jgi:hypothetical protein
LLLFYLTAHFTAIFIYAAPNDTENKLKHYASLYIYPYYHQNWGMFVPVPKQNFRVFVRDERHDWRDVFSEVILAHQKNRFGGYENTFLSMSSALRYYAAGSEKTSFFKTDDGTNMNLRVLDQVLLGYWESLYSERSQNMEIIIMITNTDTGKSVAHYYKN